MRQRILRLRGDQERRRFFVGVAVNPQCTFATAGIVAASGRGLDARFEVSTHQIEEVPREVTALYESLSRSTAARPTDATVLASQLAEVQASALNRLAAMEHDAWPRVLAAGVIDPGLWRRDVNPPDYVSLCDSTRLAELVGLNVVDAFPARDITLDGRGEPLDALPQWLLLHHPLANRLVVQLQPLARTLLLPASRDESGANHIELNDFKDPAAITSWLADCLSLTETAVPNITSIQITSQAFDVNEPMTGPLEIDELVLLGHDAAALIPSGLSHIRIIDEATLGISSEALPAACAALLAMLHLDQVPANLPLLTGATAPRVLGRLTPGNAHAWNRLLRDLAFARPLITPLRAAV
jgi:anhydro-N-acetylmuramic acid kinase